MPDNSIHGSDMKAPSGFASSIEFVFDGLDIPTTMTVNTHPTDGLRLREDGDRPWGLAARASLRRHLTTIRLN